MLFRLQYTDQFGAVITRHIIEYDGSENELIAHADRAVARFATEDNKFRVEGGSNADLRAATAEVLATP